MGPITALRFDAGRLLALDQTLLPDAEVELELGSAAEVAEAIRRLAIRGAPLLGVAGAYGVAVELARTPDDPAALARARAVLREARPTAVNLARGVDRVVAAVQELAPEERPAAALAEAEALLAEEVAAADAIASHGADFLAGARRVMTHCNAGALAVPGRGTALAVIAELHERSGLDTVIACEARPLLQGARLTVLELSRLGIPHELIVDGAAAGLIARGAVDAVVVGCDRVAANGDVANKVGTFGLALACRHAGVPMVVAGPTTTIDLACPDGSAITIEERDADEVRTLRAVRTTLPGTSCRNPAFDVTPAGLLSALVTERGVAAPVAAAAVRELAAQRAPAGG